MDVLLAPHIVTPFTLSLDAIKAYEYAASGRPVVATATSGYQTPVPGAKVAERQSFVRTVTEALRQRKGVPPEPAALAEMSWATRARQFAEQLQHAAASARL
jgi:hypothetical protein